MIVKKKIVSKERIDIKKIKKIKNAPSRARTYDPGVISTMLYRLSYESSQEKGGKKIDKKEGGKEETKSED